MSSSSEVDKEALYGEYLRDQRWKNNLSRAVAHKSLDIPEDDMQINVDKSTRSGMGIKELLAVGALAIGAGVGGNMLADRGEPTPQVAPQVVTQPATVDTDTDTINVIDFAD